MKWNILTIFSIFLFASMSQIANAYDPLDTYGAANGGQAWDGSKSVDVLPLATIDASTNTKTKVYDPLNSTADLDTYGAANGGQAWDGSKSVDVLPPVTIDTSTNTNNNRTPTAQSVTKTTIPDQATISTIEKTNITESGDDVDQAADKLAADKLAAKKLEDDKLAAENAAKSVGTSDTAGGSTGVGTMPLAYSGRYSYGKCTNVLGKDGDLEIDEDMKGILAEAMELKDKIKKYEEAYICGVLGWTIVGKTVLDSPSEYGLRSTSASMDGKVKCQSEGLTTIDYPPCTNAVTAYNAFMLGNQAVDSYHQIDLMSSNMDAQATVTAEDPISSLNAQQSSIRKQADQMEEKAIAQTAKVGTLFAMLRQMPTTESLIASCKSYEKDILELKEELAQKYKDNNKDDPAEATKKIAKSMLSPEKSIESICIQVVTKSNMAMNSKAVDALKGAMALAGVEVAKDLMMANLLNKQADQIDGLKDKFDDHDPADTVSFLPAELAKFCEENPDDPRCAGGLPLGASQFGTGGMNIEFGDPGGATTFAPGDFDEGADTGQDGIGSDVAGLDIAPGFASKAAQSAGWDGAGRSAAALKSSGAGGGGGGGGSLPGGVSAPGGGNLAPDGNGQSAVGGAKISKLGYSGGGNTALYAGSGGSKTKSGAKGDENPFAKMFGKNKPTNSSLNFRGLASDQISKSGKGLFERISSRYTSVNKSNRLVVYDVVDKK